MSREDNKIEIKKEKILIVEGMDDKYICEEILEYLKIENIQIHSINGKDKLDSFLGDFPISNNYYKIKKIGIILDADNKLVDTVREDIKKILNKNELDENKFFIFIMPDNENNGMLEDILIDSIKKKPEFECVEKFVECYESKLNFSDNLKNKNIAKSKMQAYLSIQRDKKYYVNLRMCDYDFSHPCFDKLKGFLIEVFKD